MSARSMPTAEKLGSLIERIEEFIGPDATMTMTTAGWVYIHNASDRYNLSGDDNRDAAWDSAYVYEYAGTRCIQVKRTTLIGALQAMAAFLVFPPEIADRHLRLVGGDHA